MTPQISVIMPFYNAGRYLTAAAESILAQTHRDFEFILLDDGSTDDSRPIAEGFAKRDSRVRLISRANAGFTKSLNECLALARGEFIARMDGDDVSLPHRFEYQTAFLEKHRDCVLIGTQVMLIDADGAELCPMSGLSLQHDAIDHALIHRGWPIVHPSVIMRADAVRAVGGYNNQYLRAQDHDLFLKLAERGQLANHQRILFKYRKHFDAAGSARSDDQKRVVETSVIDACRRRGIAVPSIDENPSINRSTAEEHRLWAWWALRSGNVGTARKHAWGAVRSQPWSKESWRVFYCAMRGR